MVGKRWISLIFVLIALSAVPVRAQTGSAGESRSILGRIDQFGQNLFGGIFGEDRGGDPQTDTAEEPSQGNARWSNEAQGRVGAPRQQPQGTTTGAPTVQPQRAATPSADPSMTPRAGTILTVPSRPSGGSPQSSVSLGVSEPRDSSYGAPRGTGATAPAAGAPMPSRSEAAYRQPAPSAPQVQPSRPTQSAPSGGPVQPSYSAAQGYGSPQGSSGLINPAQRPLHQRLSTMRDSAFGVAAVEDAAERAAPNPSPASSPSPQPRAATVQRPTVAEPPATRPGESLVIAQPAGAGHGVPTPAVRPSSGEPTPARPRAATEPTPVEPQVASRHGATAMMETYEAASHHGDGVLFTQKSPILSVETLGPRTISIGKESSYRVQMQNSGEVPAEEVVVFIQLPPWADILGAEASTGVTQLPTAGASEGAFLWRIGRLGARSAERLTLRLVPRQSRPFDLAVRWEYQPLSQQAMIEVQEPNLELALDGPREVHFGQRQTYKLRLRNSGTGSADDVMITLMPIGTGGNQPVSHRLGVVEAGTEKVVEVELTARQTGSITVQVEVRGEGNAAADLTETILVRRAELELAASGPQVRFVGSEVVYDLRVLNPGNAPAKNIKLSVAIPSGGTYVSGIDGGRAEAGGNRVHWVVPLLEAGAEEAYQVRVNLGLAGTNRLELTAAADDALAASAEALTQVEAIADLALVVEDPSAPVPVGNDAVYRLRVHNRGTKAAENVEVIAYFSRGIEPVSADGGTHRIGPGQVVFTPIASLAAGSEMVFTIRAKAEQAGNHVFRAEMHCKPLDTRLVREETTRFYQDGSAVADNRLQGNGSVNTADRRAAASDGNPPPQQRYGPGPEPRR